MRGRAHLMVLSAGVLLLLALLPAAAQADATPTVEYEWASNVSATDATVHAAINSEGLKDGVYYQFQVVKNVSEYSSEIVCPERALPSGHDSCGPVPLPHTGMPIGFIPDGSSGQSVSQDLTGAGIALQPNTTYHYRVIVVKSVLTEDTLEWEGPPVYGPDQTFTTPAAEAPTVEGESISDITPTGATLEATINPQDSERRALYQFQLVANPKEYLTEFSCPAAHNAFCPLGGRLSGTAEEGLPFGETEVGVGGQTVSLDLSHAGVALKPGTTYHYRVIAARYQQEEEGPGWEAPIVYGSDQTFTTPPSNAPVIESVSVSHISATDATLEATINTEDLSTSYEFELWSSPCSHHGGGCELLIDIPLPTGLLLGSFLPQTVSLDLNSAGVKLEGGEYGFLVKATNKEGSATKSGGVFEPLEEPVVETLNHSVTPGPAGDEPEIPLGGDRPSTSGGGSSPVPTGGPLPAGVKSKPAHGKPSTKHGKRHKHQHHGRQTGKHHTKKSEKH